MLLGISFKLSTTNLARLVHTNASKLQPGSYLREAGVLWQVQSLKYVSPDATVPSEIAPQTIDANTTLALQLIDISSRVIRPTTMKATDTVTSIHNFPPMFEGGKNRTKIWFWLDKPAFDGRSDFMMDTVKAGISLQAHELHVGSRVISHWNEDQPLHVTIPEDHLPSSARIQTSQATGLSYSPPHA